MARPTAAGAAFAHRTASPTSVQSTALPAAPGKSVLNAMSLQAANSARTGVSGRSEAAQQGVDDDVRRLCGAQLGHLPGHEVHELGQQR